MTKTTLHQALTAAKQALEASSDSPQLDALLLLSVALQKPRTFLYTHPHYILTANEERIVDDYLLRRVSGEPMAYILGEREFWSLSLTVTADTLVPRPETEILVETALAQALPHSALIADLGTGSGAIAIALASVRPEWEISAIDVSERALDVAKKNAATLGFANISFYCGDWSTVLPGLKQFDMIISNPPYLTDAEWAASIASLGFEPKMALAAGSDGLDAIREIVALAVKRLAHEGWLLIEHGFKQSSAVQSLFMQAGFRHVRTVNDLAGLPRVTQGQYCR